MSISPIMLKSATDTAGAQGSTAANAANGASAPAAAASSVDDASQRFLTLLVSQLQNQDPLNPMDNSQITSQLAQLSTVTGVNKINDTLASLSSSLDANQYMQSASLVGHDIVVTGNQVQVSDGTGRMAYALKGDADTVTISIKDAAGTVVRTIDAGAGKADVHFVDWDGKDNAGKSVADGTYTFDVTATAQKASVDTTALTIGHVSGLIPGSGGGQLQLGALGRVDLSQVIEIL